MGMMKAQLVDMIRAVPEVAVRLWCGAKPTGNENGTVKISFEGRSIDVSREVYFKAQEVTKILQVRPRALKLVQDVLELRHEAEDVFLENVFGKQGIPRVLFVPAGESASGYYRAMIPSELMFEDGQTISHFTMSVDLAKVLRYDILWIQLITSPVLFEIARRAKEAGIKIVFDIDDRLDAIPEGNQAASVYGNPEKQREMDDMIRLADVVTVSTAPLGVNMKERGAKRVMVLPNRLTANVMPRKHPSNPAYTKILWAGSPTHKRDLAIVAPALSSVLKRHDGKVRFTCFGERLPEALSDCYPFVDLKDPVDFEEYHDALASLGADFGIAPLEANAFNASKSAVKALEYAAAEYPMLLSPVGEYPAVVRDGLPAELVENDGWEAALERMIARSREERASMGKAVLQWVLENRCMGRTKAREWSEVALSVYEKPAPAPALEPSSGLLVGPGTGRE